MFEVLLMITLQLSSWIDDIRHCNFPYGLMIQDCSYVAYFLFVMLVGNLALFSEFWGGNIAYITISFSWIDDISVLCCSFGYFFRVFFILMKKFWLFRWFFAVVIFLACVLLCLFFWVLFKLNCLSFLHCNFSCRLITVSLCCSFDHIF